MLRRIALILMCATLPAIFLLSAPAYPSDWLQIESPLGGETNYIDLSSIKTEKAMITFWARNIDIKGEITETRYSINCNNDTGAIRDIVLYGAGKTQINSYSYKDKKPPWGKITAGSLLRPFQKLLCNP